MSKQSDQFTENFEEALTTRPREARQVMAQVGMRQGKKADPSLFLLAVDRIRPDADQVRRMGKSEEDDGIKELAASIRQLGIQEPLNVRWLEQEDIYQLIAGERRYTAAKLIGLTEVPVKLIEATDREAKLRQLHENIHREDLHPSELAAALRPLQQEGASVADLAAMLSKSETFVRKALSVDAELTDEAKEIIAEQPDKFDSMEVLYDVSKVAPEKQAETLKQIAAEDMTRDAVRKHTAKAKKEHREARGEKRGKQPKGKPFQKSFKSSNGATITVAFKKTSVTAEEQIAALEEIIDKLRA